MDEDINILIKEQSDKGVLRLVMNNLDYKNVSTFTGATITEAVYGGLTDTAKLVNIKAGG